MKKGIANYGVGENFQGFLLVKKVQKGIARNNNGFLTLTLGDKSGDIESKVWDNVEQALAYYSVESIVEVQGVITEFQGKKQLNSNFMRAVTEDEHVTVADLLQSAPVSGNDLLEKVYEVINHDIHNDKIKAITKAVIQNFEEDFKVYPAASKNHHAYVSGLAYHTVGMLRIAESFCALYPELNKDLLFAGVILHDIGKIREYEGIVNTEYSFEGKLLGHISMINEEIGMTAKSLGIEGEEVTLLKHLVLSHHGKLEWGSPVQPIIMEAEILHLIDMVDAKMDTLRTALRDVPAGEFTERLFSMGNRSFYKPLI
ncbi:3'-5' exoribonuclease [Cerasibacillus quisquiliarum]|uniref:3'-5' exoribonuclease YhaM n=1 Tax=Cerasibacillus quisquiliarum TaxID=227865 RepID=A0A511UYU5_9BACI|nr:HD domain-containing protein [Cerasibacillus quisquiliarum]MBB5146205.1 3'-5' exoribonuclease [Cerasibacillus quisquiliarum]GEN30938.1 3'-5' exoribonuclease YhaM [Cerasibacillus quisquiliarum]